MNGQNGARGRLVFVLLLTLSVLYFLFFEPNFQFTGFFIVLWGCLSLVHVIWMSETIKRAQEEASFNSGDERPPMQKAGRGLAQSILYNLSRVKNREEVATAVRLVSPYFLWAMIFFTAFLGAGSLASFKPVSLPEIVGLSQSISSYLQDNDVHSFVHFDPFFHERFVALGKILMIGLAFWVAQANGRNISVLWCSVLFVLSLGMSMWYSNFTQDILLLNDSSWLGVGWAHLPLLQDIGLVSVDVGSSFTARLYEVGWIGAASLYICALILAVHFVPISLKYVRHRGRGVVLAGGIVLVLLVLLMADFFLERHGALDGLWISGWVLLGVLFAQVDGDDRHSMRLNLR